MMSTSSDPVVELCGVRGCFRFSRLSSVCRSSAWERRSRDRPRDRSRLDARAPVGARPRSLLRPSSRVSFRPSRFNDDEAGISPRGKRAPAEASPRSASVLVLFCTFQKPRVALAFLALLAFPLALLALVLVLALAQALRRARGTGNAGLLRGCGAVPTLRCSMSDTAADVTLRRLI